jgi:hypothetical protein
MKEAVLNYLIKHVKKIQIMMNRQLLKCGNLAKVIKILKLE